MHSHASLETYHGECVRAGITGEASNTSVLLHHVIPEVTLAMALDVVVCQFTSSLRCLCIPAVRNLLITLAWPWSTPVERCACTHVVYTEAVGCRQAHHSSELLKRCDSQAIRLAQVCFCNSIVITCRHRVCRLQIDCDNVCLYALTKPSACYGESSCWAPLCTCQV